MGRKTWDSLPIKPLPNRANIIITHNPIHRKGLNVGNFTMDTFKKLLPHLNGKVFIIGGATVYTQALPLSDRLYLTQIDAEFPEADTFFPEIDQSDWDATFCERHASSEKCPHSFAFVNFQRK